jgi:hypothetical protein
MGRDEIAEEYAETGPDGIDPERARAVVLVEEIGNDRRSIRTPRE